MKTVIIAAVLIMANNGAAYAQTSSGLAPVGPICWLAGLAFSPGATARASSKVMVCGVDGTWLASGEDAAGCFNNGKISGTLAVKNLTNNKAKSVECQADGTWKLIPNK